MTFKNVFQREATEPMSDDGLRSLPPTKGLNRRGLLRGFKYVPLGILFTLVLIAGAGGYVEKRMNFAEAQAAAGLPEETSTPSEPLPATLPAECRPTVDQQITNEPWLDPALAATSEATFQEGLTTQPPGYIEGQNGWLFFADDVVEDFSQSVGRITQSPERIEAWANYISTLQQQAEAGGSEFYAVVAPGKWDVYPQNLPFWAQKLRGSVSYDRLLSAHPELPIIDIRQPLRDAAQTTATYSPQNSHWTDFGGFVAWQAISDCLTAVDGNNSILAPPAATGVTYGPDFNEYAPLGAAAGSSDTWTTPQHNSPLSKYSATGILSGAQIEVPGNNQLGMAELPAITQSESATSDKTLLALRDSTGSAVSPYWSNAFSTTVQYLHGINGVSEVPDLSALLTEHNPDITLLVLTERYLNSDPPLIGELK